ncbi:MAG: hypothetical protein ABR570_14005 [Burkholderiales bacterium]
MFTYVVLFLLLAVVAGVLMLSIEGAMAPIMFGVALLLFIGSGFAYMRERYGRR